MQIFNCFDCKRHLPDYETSSYLIAFDKCGYELMITVSGFNLSVHLSSFSAAQYDREVLDVLSASRVSVDTIGGVGVVSTN